MWKRLLNVLAQIIGRPQQDRASRRTLEARSRFWSDVHEGRAQAEAASRDRPVVSSAKR